MRRAEERVRRRVATAIDPMALDLPGTSARSRTSWRPSARSGRRAVDGPESLKALEIVLAVYRSAELGRPVELPVP